MKSLFVSEKHYQRYLYAKEKAIKINKYLNNKKYIVLKRYGEDYMVKDGLFVFSNNNKPVIILKSGNVGNFYFGCKYNKDGLIYIDSKKTIDSIFNDFIIFRLQDKISNLSN